MRTRDQICQMLTDGPATSEEMLAELEASYKAIRMSLGRLKRAGKIRVIGTVESSRGRRPFYLWELNHATDV